MIYHIRQLAAVSGLTVIATCVVHSKLDYCNYLYYKLPNSQLSRIQHIQNSLARTVTFDRSSSDVTGGLKLLRKKMPRNAQFFCNFLINTQDFWKRNRCASSTSRDVSLRQTSASSKQYSLRYRIDENQSPHQPAYLMHCKPKLPLQKIPNLYPTTQLGQSCAV